jgi:hypothetical protein
MDSQQHFQVGKSFEHPTVGPLSLWERAGVRVKRAQKRRPLRIAFFMPA